MPDLDFLSAISKEIKTAKGNIAFTIFPKEQIGIIGNVVVNEPYRRQGIATNLMKQAIGQIQKDYGITAIGTSPVTSKEGAFLAKKFGLSYYGDLPKLIDELKQPIRRPKVGSGLAKIASVLKSGILKGIIPVSSITGMVADFVESNNELKDELKRDPTQQEIMNRYLQKTVSGMTGIPFEKPGKLYGM